MRWKPSEAQEHGYVCTLMLSNVCLKHSVGPTAVQQSPRLPSTGLCLGELYFLFCTFLYCLHCFFFFLQQAHDASTIGGDMRLFSLVGLKK